MQSIIHNVVGNIIFTNILIYVIGLRQNWKGQDTENILNEEFVQKS